MTTILSNHHWAKLPVYQQRCYYGHLQHHYKKHHILARLLDPNNQTVYLLFQHDLLRLKSKVPKQLEVWPFKPLNTAGKDEKLDFFHMTLVVWQVYLFSSTILTIASSCFCRIFKVRIKLRKKIFTAYSISRETSWKVWRKERNDNRLCLRYCYLIFFRSAHYERND